CRSAAPARAACPPSRGRCTTPRSRWPTPRSAPTGSPPARARRSAGISRRTRRSDACSRLPGDAMADDFTQANRRLRIETPLGPDALLITALTGTEGISTLFHFRAELIGRDEHANFDAIVGKNVTDAIAAAAGDRYLNGIVSRFMQSGTVGRHASYTADILAWPWFLTRTTDCRIFQKKSVPDIVKQLFAEYGLSDYRFQLTGSYE